MAIQKEIWLPDIVEGLFADNSFMSKAFNADEFVNGKTVHIPNAGAASGVKKNRKEYPAQVSVREDFDLTFSIDEFTTDPIRISNAESVELSYNKRNSVISTEKEALHDAVARSMLVDWAPKKTSSIIKTTGETIDAYTPSAAGQRKAFTKADVSKAMQLFNVANVPAVNRYMLLDAMMYSQLIDSMSTKDADAFHALADLKNGIVGKLYGFNIMMRSEVLIYDGNTPVDFGSKETDNAAALAWHTNSVVRALGEVNMFENEKDPTYYGDIYSFLLRAGGAAMRNDGKGVLAIVQDTVA